LTVTVPIATATKISKVSQEFVLLFISYYIIIKSMGWFYKMKGLKGTVLLFDLNNVILWYHRFYDTMHSYAISTNFCRHRNLIYTYTIKMYAFFFKEMICMQFCLDYNKTVLVDNRME
jgi:hypothetical protein